MLSSFRRVARGRPEAPIIGLTPHLTTARRTAVVWGLHAVVTADAHSMSEAVAPATRVAQAEGFARHGDEIVVAAGVPFGHSGTTTRFAVRRSASGWFRVRRAPPPAFR